jgi:RNA-directed DNA polymerase
MALRPLGLPAVRDRIVPGALRHVLEPIFATELAAHSYGCRPGRGALLRFQICNFKFQIAEAGHVWVVDADRKSYFDTLPHARLLALVKARVADGRVLARCEISNLKFQISEAGVLAAAQGWRPTEGGTPQGGVLSPLLANRYLAPLDHQMAAAGGEMIRYPSQSSWTPQNRTPASICKCLLMRGLSPKW